METIDRDRFDVASSMDVNALKYIHMVNDHQQFPAARVSYGTEKGYVIYLLIVVLPKFWQYRNLQLQPILVNKIVILSPKTNDT